MTTETLLEQLVSQEALKERNKLLADTQKQVNDILSQAEEKARVQIAQNKKVFEHKAQMARSKIVHGAEFQAQINESQVREEIAKAFLLEIAKQLQAACKQPDYKKLLTQLLEEALTQIDRKSFVCVRSEDRVLVQEILIQMGRSAIPVKNERVKWGGICLVSEDGLIVLDNSLESRFKKAQEVYKGSIGKDLFHEL